MKLYIDRERSRITFELQKCCNNKPEQGKYIDK